MSTRANDGLPSSVVAGFAAVDAAAIGYAAHLVFEHLPLAATLGVLSGAGGYLLIEGLLGADDDADDRGVAGTGLDPVALGVALSNAAVGGFAAAFALGVESLVVGGIVGAGIPGYFLGTLLADGVDADRAATPAD
jgi:hypothetical protein